MKTTVTSDVPLRSEGGCRWPRHHSLFRITSQSWKWWWTPVGRGNHNLLESTPLRRGWRQVAIVHRRGWGYTVTFDSLLDLKMEVTDPYSTVGWKGRSWHSLLLSILSSKFIVELRKLWVWQVQSLLLVKNLVLGPSRLWLTSIC